MPPSFKLRPFRPLNEKVEERDFTEETVFYDNDAGAAQARTRASMWAFHALLLLGLGLLVWRAAGLAWAAGALGWIALDPTLMAHAPVAMTDLPLTLTLGIAGCRDRLGCLYLALAMCRRHGTGNRSRSRRKAFRAGRIDGCRSRWVYRRARFELESRTSYDSRASGKSVRCGRDRLDVSLAALRRAFPRLVRWDGWFQCVDDSEGWRSQERREGRDRPGRSLALTAASLPLGFSGYHSHGRGGPGKPPSLLRQMVHRTSAHLLLARSGGVEDSAGPARLFSARPGPALAGAAFSWEAGTSLLHCDGRRRAFPRPAFF